MACLPKQAQIWRERHPIPFRAHWGLNNVKLKRMRGVGCEKTFQDKQGEGHV